MCPAVHLSTCKGILFFNSIMNENTSHRLSIEKGYINFIETLFSQREVLGLLDNCKKREEKKKGGGGRRKVLTL